MSIAEAFEYAKAKVVQAFQQKGLLLTEHAVMDDSGEGHLAATMFLGWGKWALIVGGVLGMFICGGMMIFGRRNRSSTAVDGATGIPWALGGLTVGAIAATVVGTVL